MATIELEPVPPVARPRNRITRFLWLLLPLVLAVIVLYPALMLLYGSFRDAPPGVPSDWTLKAYANLFSSPRTLELIRNTLLFAVPATLIGVALGFFLAFVTTMTDTPGVKYLSLIVLVRFIIPPVLSTVSWMYMLNARTGPVNVALRSLLGIDAPSGPINLFTMGGMIFVMVTSIFPIAYAFLLGPMRAMRGTILEASRVSGAGVVQTLFRIVLPLSAPATLAATLLLFAISLEVFEVPAFIGIPGNIPVLTVDIFLRVTKTVPADYATAAAYGLLLSLVVGGLVFAYRKVTAVAERYATVAGRGYGETVLHLGKWRFVTMAVSWGLLIALVGSQFVMLVLLSLAPARLVLSGDFLGRMSLDYYAAVLTDPVSSRALRNSLLVATSAATLTLAVGFLISYVARRTRLAGRSLLEYLSLVPLGVPSTALAVGLLWAYVGLPLPIYGTVAILVIALFTRYLPWATGATSGSVNMVHRELEEASRTSGGSFFQTLRRIMLPLTRGGLIAGWSLLFVLAIRELSASVLLYSSGSEVVPVLIWQYYFDSQIGPLSALGVLLILIVTPIVVLADRLTGGSMKRQGGGLG